MKRNITLGILLIGALALGSCSTTKLASNQANTDDDVYYSNATAGEQPEYVAQNNTIANQDRYNNTNDDDYYYYDSYASRINRFNYYSPFNYYDDFYSGYPYYGYSPYFGASLYNPYFGFGFGYTGYGYGLGYDPLYYGYGAYYGYSPYSYWGIGYGGYPYWGTVSAYRTAGNARPYRPLVPGGANASTSRATRPIGYNGRYPINANYPGRPAATGVAGQRTMSNGRNQGNQGYSRPQRPTYNNNQGQTYQPQPQVQRSSPPPSSPPPSSSGGGESGRSSGGGGGRPVRP